MTVWHTSRFGLLLAAVLTAFMVPGVAPATETRPVAGAGATIVVVPLEPPPLIFMPGIELEHALAANTGAALSYAGADATAEAGRALYVLSRESRSASEP